MAADPAPRLDFRERAFGQPGTESEFRKGQPLLFTKATDVYSDGFFRSSCVFLVVNSVSLQETPVNAPLRGECGLITCSMESCAANEPLRDRHARQPRLKQPCLPTECRTLAMSEPMRSTTVSWFSDTDPPVPEKTGFAFLMLSITF